MLNLCEKDNVCSCFGMKKDGNIQTVLFYGDNKCVNFTFSETRLSYVLKNKRTSVLLAMDKFYSLTQFIT